jgi:hypothetical protein
MRAVVVICHMLLTSLSPNLLEHTGYRMTFEMFRPTKL